MLTEHLGQHAKNERLKRGVISLGETDVLNRFIKIYSLLLFGDQGEAVPALVTEQVAADERYAREALRPLYPMCSLSTR